MPIEFVEFNGKDYPAHQSIGNAAQWIIPLAMHYCSGFGVDVGYSKPEWKFPGALGIEPSIDARYSADSLPKGEFDFLFSSHMLEHYQGNWMTLLDYWLTKIKFGGILFLYLPHSSQEYWHPKNNRKHVHSFDGSEIYEYLKPKLKACFVSGPDHNNSFVFVGEK